jgi:hypothetical protein
MTDNLESDTFSRAISERVRFKIAERGLSIIMFASLANLSLCLMSSKEGRPPLRPKPYMRTSTQEPFNFLPCSANLSALPDAPYLPLGPRARVFASEFCCGASRSG